METITTKILPLLEQFITKYNRDPNGIILERNYYMKMKEELSALSQIECSRIEYLNVIGLSLRIYKCLDNDNEIRICLTD